MSASIRLLVAFPSTDLVHAGFACDLAMLMVMTDQKQIPVDLLLVQTAPISTARHACALEALQGGFSHLLFLDTDQRFPATTAIRLLGHQKPIVGATYRKRMMPHDLNHVELDETVAGHLEPDEVGLRKVQSLPGGCLLIETKVFTKLKPPYFRFEYQGEKLYGEDVLFCRDAREAGYAIWMDCDLSREVGHLGVQEFKV
jgi:hypothetical protein